MGTNYLHLTNSLPRNRSLFGQIAVLLLYAAIYLKDWASPLVSSSIVSILLATGLFVGFGDLALRLRKRSYLNSASVYFLSAFIAIWLLSLVIRGAPNLSSYYIAIPCAFLIINSDVRFFIWLLSIHLVLTLGVEAAEYLSGQYLFVYQADDGTELDETLFGGGLEVFRAKGLFQGPLSAVAFAVWMAFFFRSNLWVVATLFFCAFFASGRLGMTVAVVLFFFRIWKNRSAVIHNGKALAGLFAVIISAVFLFAHSDENRLFFISTAFDTSNDQNVSRIYFWLTSLGYFLNYGLMEMLFGDYGFILRQEGGTENDFLRLLLDCGLIGFALYVGAILVQVARAIRQRDGEGLLIGVLIFVLMNIFPFVQSLSSSLLFWCFVFIYMERKALLSARHGSGAVASSYV